ncbi:MBL fold metallo-hydrolase [Acinetobacter sp. 'aerobic (ED)']|uniref:MBL fold metallo-hydrolase n=1 Tax=Acinetobacter sp. 'aerobic (ED)' TaxID=174230 RepID=UPI00192AACC0|nr:MBL fold metallo-hydrolase [Acinetobacter sp. 'aerobic (ED)']
MNNDTTPAFKIGEFLVNVLNDGEMNVSLDLLSGIAINEATELQNQVDIDKINTININAYLIRSSGKTILVDTGLGKLNSTAGFLLEELNSIGVFPEDIDTILITHAHPDHIGGLLNEDGQVIYKNAELYLHSLEFEYWMDDYQLEKASERGKRNFQLVRNILKAYENVLNFTDKKTIMNGIRPILLAGHTPGHTGFYIESNNQSLLIWGDIIHFPNIQLKDPSITIAFDCDTHQAVATRKKILEQVVIDDQLVAGMHLGKMGFAHISCDHKKESYIIKYI